MKNACGVDGCANKATREIGGADMWILGKAIKVKMYVCNNHYRTVKKLGEHKGNSARYFITTHHHKEQP